MLRRELVELPEHLYPREPWRLVESAWDEQYADRAETVFAVGNGYLGVRGTHDEGRPSLSPGTFLNGFHETWPITHGEDAYGLAGLGQTIVNAPDATVLALYVDDEPFLVSTGRVREYRRVLDMRLGTLERELVWSTPGGKHVKVRSRRVVSWEHRHLMAIDYEVTLLDHRAPVTISSQVLNHQDRPHQAPARGRGLTDPRLARVFTSRVLNLEHHRDKVARLLLGYRTTNSNMTLGVGVDHVIDVPDGCAVSTRVEADRSEVVIEVDARAGGTVHITKFVAYHTSAEADPDELADRCARTLNRAVRGGFDALLESQAAQLDRFWRGADVQVQADEDGELLQQAVRWNLFQVGQATWRAEGTGVPAKGLTGQAYDGHYFWDTEVYLLPFLCYTQPRIARNLLRFRHSQLPRARMRARDLAVNGATFPWRTINGDEASGDYQAGTAQVHINGDIAYALRRYVHVRGDVGFLAEAGAEILVETARMWADLGFYGEDGRFHIHGVTGPDEYTTVVNDNAYTNLIAQLNLRFAASAVTVLRRDRTGDYTSLVHKTGVREDEVAAWERAAEAMTVAYDARSGVHPQDAAFLERERWDLQATPRENFPLLLHYHPLVIYRHQVIKQADVVLAMFLLGDQFSTAQKRRNYEYYEPLTTGDSSLSASVQSIVAAEIGEQKAAVEYFRYALLMDLGDVAGDVSDGVHVASAAGVWLALAYGFAGLRDFDGQLSFDPHLPAGWTRLRLPLRFHDRQLDVTLGHTNETYELLSGDPLDVTVRGHVHRLTPDGPLVLPVSAHAMGSSRKR